MLTFWFDVYLIVAYDFISIFLAGNCEPNFWLASTIQSIVANMILKQAASPFDLINLSYLLLVEHVSKTAIHS